MDDITISRAALRSRAAQLRESREPFVTATVVLTERPASARPGDIALVLADGTVLGFVGGECAEASVVAYAQQSLATGEPALLRITPTGQGDAGATVEATAPATARSGVAGGAQSGGPIIVHNPCLSGGTLEIFLEPELPPPLLVVHGEAPIALALRQLACELGYAVAVAALSPGDEPLPPDAVAVVVASHGRDEAAVLRAGLASGAHYIGLVASRRRGTGVLDALDLTEEERGRIHSPAGLDIHAVTPGEIALSILAEIVASRPAPQRRGAVSSGSASGAAAPPATALDPVCGMTVATLDTVLHADHRGKWFFFCGPGCRDAFTADPASFLAK
jgi:xanthine dehydrogenase accessory factor